MLAAISIDAILKSIGHNAPSAVMLAVFVSVIAYVHSPRIKALIFSMPVPFTCAYLATGLSIDTTNISAIFLGVTYHWLVFALVRKRGWPIGVAIAIAVTFFVTGAALLRPVAVLPFMPAVFFVLIAWFVGFLAYRPHSERGHRSTAPWWLKAPLVFVLALVIYALTGLMGGAVMLFPYAGVFASYEMRHSLRTLAGHYMVNNIAIIALLVAMWMIEHSSLHGPLWALAAGWSALLTVHFLMHALGLRRKEVPVPTGD